MWIEIMYANNYALSGEVQIGLGTILRTLMGHNATPSKDYASLFATYKQPVETALANLRKMN